VNDSRPTKEFKFNKSNNILGYINRFSHTEKFIFGVLIVISLFTALILAFQLNNAFVIEIPTYGGTLKEGIVGLPRMINPVIAVTDTDKDLNTLVYSGLTKYTNGQLTPDLASSWNISDDGLTYTFELRKNLKFQDGKPLTSEDVLFTIQKIQDPSIKSPKHSDWTNITIKAETPTKITFTLKQPYTPFLSNTTIGIIPKHIWGSVNNDQFIFSQYNTEPIGSGPYKLSSIDRDSGGIPIRYNLSSWNGYYGKKPYLDNIEMYFFNDESTAISTLNSGYIDSLSGISTENTKLLISNKSEPYKIITSSMPRIFSAFFNQNQNIILSDINIRKALSISIDHQKIVNEILNGYGSTIDSPFIISGSSTVNVYNEKQAFEQASKLIEKSGWTKNYAGIYEKKTKNNLTPLSLSIYTADNPELKKVAEILKQTWQKLGARVDIKIFESGDLYQNIIRTRKYDILLFGQFIGREKDVYAFWHSSQRNYPGLNVAMYINSKADKIMEDIRITNKEEDRRKLYNELNELIKEDYPATFLYSPSFTYAVPKILEGVKIENITNTSDRLLNITDWYIKKDKVWKLFQNKIFKQIKL
jgi:peptide/nickel transport system substrate-binding protein